MPKNKKTKKPVDNKLPDLFDNDYFEKYQEQKEFYRPKNDQEKREFALVRLVRIRENKINRDSEELARLEKEVSESDLDREVHEMVLKNLDKNQADEWQYFWSADAFCSINLQADELKNSIKYDSLWVKEAKKMITTERYENVPSVFLDLSLHEEKGDKHFDCDDNCCGEGNFEPIDVPF